MEYKCSALRWNLLLKTILMQSLKFLIQNVFYVNLNWAAESKEMQD